MARPNDYITPPDEWKTRTQKQLKPEGVTIDIRVIRDVGIEIDVTAKEFDGIFGDEAA